MGAPMTKTNIVLAVAAAVAMSGCFVFLRDLNIEQARVAVLEGKVARLQRDLQAPKAVIVEPAASRSASPAKPAAAPASAAKTSTASNVAAARKREQEEWRQLNADPAYRAARLAEHRLRLTPQYEEIIAELGLSQAEADRFLNLLAEQSLRDSTSAMYDTDEDRRLGARIRERQDRAARERKEVLGEDRFRAWTEYVNSAGARSMVSELRTQLATSSSPLREDQVKPLVKVLAAEHQRHAAERQANHDSGTPWTEATPAAEQIAYMERRARLIEESLERSSEAAAMYLDSVQQQRFDAMTERQRQHARIDLASWRASIEADERARVVRRER